jgi:hypothetical protein
MNGVGRVRGAPSFAFERSSVLALGANDEIQWPHTAAGFFHPCGPLSITISVSKPFICTPEQP